MRKILPLIITALAVAFLTGLWLGALTCKAFAADLPDDWSAVSEFYVRPTVERVAALLQQHGYATTGDDMPLVFLGDVPRGVAALTAHGVIVLSRQRSIDCMETDLAHEAAHWLLGKYHGLTPRQSEPLARAVENALMSTGAYLPNCEAR